MDGWKRMESMGGVSSSLTSHPFTLSLSLLCMHVSVSFCLVGNWGRDPIGGVGPRSERGIIHESTRG